MWSGHVTTAVVMSELGDIHLGKHHQVLNIFLETFSYLHAVGFVFINAVTLITGIERVAL